MTQSGQPQKPGRTDQNGSTFETDISETDEDGTTVREAEVREDDLSEVKPSSPDQSSET